MRIIDTSTTDPKSLTPFEREQVYNGLDVCITAELLDVLLPQLDNQTAATYAFSRSLQGPVLEMRLRGVLVDQAAKAEVIETYFDQIDRLETQLERIVREGVGFHGFQWRSNPDLHRLFYKELGLPVIKRGGKPTVNRDALEKMEMYLVAKQIVAHLLLMRDIGKKISVLKTDIDADGRMRTSYNIAGTDTGRFSSSFSEFGTGGNMQNIEDLLRRVFIADPGMKLAYLDAQQGESYCVGAIEWNLFKDDRYLNACESGDLHTTVAKLCWPDLAWKGDMVADKELAEQPYYRHYSRRFMCKKIGHGTNYGGKPRTISNQAKIEIGIIEDFQPKYFKAFPAHLRWHGAVERAIRSEGMLVSLTGRKRQFWGRRDADDTFRAALAFDPQGSLADIVNTGMLRVWEARDAILLMQNHDAVVVEFPEDLEDVIIPKLKNQLTQEVELSHGRTLRIPYDAKTGWNWGEWKEGENPNGLKSYKPGDKRKREAAVSILDRRVR